MLHLHKPRPGISFKFNPVNINTQKPPPGISFKFNPGNIGPTFYPVLIGVFQIGDLLGRYQPIIPFFVLSNTLLAILTIARLACVPLFIWVAKAQMPAWIGFVAM
jgi:hypothetical protein